MTVRSRFVLTSVTAWPLHGAGATNVRHVVECCSCDASASVVNTYIVVEFCEFGILFYWVWKAAVNESDSTVPTRKTRSRTVSGQLQ